LGDGQFAVKFDFETTFKPTGLRTLMTEMALYDVAREDRAAAVLL